MNMKTSHDRITSMLADLPNCKKYLFVDLDNTLAIPGNRNLWDASTCEADGINRGLQLILQHLPIPFGIITARPQKFRSQTLSWLKKHEIPYDVVNMKPLDQSEDGISALSFKEKFMKDTLELWHQAVPEIEILAFEDDPSICDAYRRMGVHVVQVLPIS